MPDPVCGICSAPGGILCDEHAGRASRIEQQHIEHYRNCGCLGDSAECCDPSCPCHQIVPPFDSREHLAEVIGWCERAGIDPYPIMADELRALGWTVEEPDAR